MGGTLWVFKYLCERLWSKRRLGTCRVLPTHVNVLMTVFEKPSIRIKVLFPRAELSIDTFGVLCLTVTSVIKYCSTSNYYYLFMGFSNLLSEFKTLFYYEKTNNTSIYLSQKSRSPTTTASPPRPPPIWAPFAAARSQRWFFTSDKTGTVWSELRAFPHLREPYSCNNFQIGNFVLSNGLRRFGGLATCNHTCSPSCFHWVF